MIKKTLLIVSATIALGVPAPLHAEEADKAPKADNTKLNERDREGMAPTAQDQGNSQEDIQMTAKIRKGLMDDDKLSQYAKNVKIITKDGQVTLRGPVRSQQEKSAIGMKAQQLAGGQRVDNQLDVAPGGGQEKETSGRKQDQEKSNQKDQ